MALHEMERWDEALEAFEKAIALEPDLPEAWRNKGVALERLNRYKEAQEAFQHLVELTPNNSAAWLQLG